MTRHQLHWRSAQFALHAILLFAWILVFGSLLTAAPASSFHRALLTTTLGPTILEFTGLVVAVNGGTVFIRALLEQTAGPSFGDSGQVSQDAEDDDRRAHPGDSEPTDADQILQDRTEQEALGSHLRDPEEIKIGRIIGNLERILIYLLALNGQLDAIGLVLAAKSLARFKELEDKSFSEYYLLGTLSSTLFALLVAWLVTATTSLVYPKMTGALTLALGAE